MQHRYLSLEYKPFNLAQIENFLSELNMVEIMVKRCFVYDDS